MGALARLLLFDLLLWFLEANCQEPVVSLRHGGQVEGEAIQIQLRDQVKRVNQYLGIPYAEPPVNLRRFAKAMKKSGWQGIIAAKSLPNCCWQIRPGNFDKNNRGALMWFPNTKMSEDCLYLNVWAPEKPKGNQDNMPVMVWIYGGGFFSGSSTLDVYNGSILAASQNVVVVSMQYRIGAFGFLRVPVDTLGVEEDALGNEGLHDQALALQWIQENIEYFGGDKQSVTLFGESAGAVSVSAHWLSPSSRGLFKRAIMESASIYARWAYFTREEAHERANTFIKGCRCPTTGSRQDILNCLRKVKEQDLVGKLSTIYDLVNEKRRESLKKHTTYLYSQVLKSEVPFYLYFDAPLRPVIDGIFFPKDPEELMKEREKMPGPELLIGVNRNEGMYFLLNGLLLKDTTFLSDDGIVNLPKSLMNFHKNGTILLYSIAQFLDTEYMKFADLATKPAYFYKLGKSYFRKMPRQLMKRLDAYTGDLDFICPTLKFADKVSQIPDAKVFFYSFEKRTERLPMPKWVGVMHGYETEYIFGMPRSDIFQKNFYSFTEKERKISDLVMELWANFARDGNPNTQACDIETDWPLYKASDPYGAKYLIIGDKLRKGRNLRKQGCLFWSKTMPALLEYMSHHTTIVASPPLRRP